MFLCCGWQMRAFSRRVSLRRMLSLSANAGMSHKIRPSANNALSLSVTCLSISPFSSLFFFLILFLSSASFHSTFSLSVSGEIWFTRADFPVFESRATNVKFAKSARWSDGSWHSATQGFAISEKGGETDANDTYSLKSTCLLIFRDASVQIQI